MKEEYMSDHFVSPPDPAAFNATVWEIVRQVPAGKVATYGQIATLVPPPKGISLQDYRAFGPRWVGGAMAACPAGVPWQRVINSQGKISLRKGGGPDVQKELLEAEGVEFDDYQRVDLKRFGWHGPQTVS
jgi:methylated-DNA-protein-cysteine methyltransferase related protein